MCQRVTCSNCGKSTFAGCGRHVEAVLGDVRPEDRCSCSASKTSSVSRSWLDALFGAKGASR